MSGLVALGWGLLVAVALGGRWGRGPVGVTVAPPESVLGQLGAWAQSRVPVLASLATTIVGAVLVASLLLLAFHPLLAVLVTATLVAAGVVARGAVRARRLRRLADAAPGGWELLRLAVDGGATLPDAVSSVADGLDDPFGRLLADVERRVRRGQSFPQALEAAGGWAGDHVGQPFATVAAAHRSGAPLAVALGRAAARQRTDLRHRAESRARRLPVLLLIPLVTCVLPSFALLTIVPMIGGGARGLTLP